MKHRFQTNYNREHFPVKGEKNRLPSQTVPDQALSVRELLDRHARGLPLGGTKVPIYEPDNDLPDLKSLDLADIQTLKEANEAEIEHQKQNLSKHRALRQKAPIQLEIPSDDKKSDDSPEKK